MPILTLAELNSKGEKCSIRSNCLQNTLNQGRIQKIQEGEAETLGTAAK